ncbi:MAG: GNAT family N-acetyltransferase [Candidatus Saccharibacteria bacterium]|nr:GNAT family N-acetyltransferase [Candidatus Saccharibacteria bacterium]
MLKADATIIVDKDITLKRFSHDVDKIKYETILVNRNHLLPWLPWVDDLYFPTQTYLFTEKQIKEFDSGHIFSYNIFFKNIFAGSIAIYNISERDHNCELGYWLDHSHTGKGIMTRTVKIATNYAMQKLNMHRVAIKVAPENNASVSVAERLGFEREALLRDGQYLVNRFYDAAIYVKIKDN